METPAPPTVDVLRRNNVRVSGDPAGRPLVFVHGYGCSQAMWRRLAPRFADGYRVVLLDLVGAGASDHSAYDAGKYDSLQGYAGDLLEILDALDLRDAVIVGHSVSAMISVLAANDDASRIGALVLIGPSPRYVNVGDYVGGFEQEDIDALIDSLDANYLGWSETMAPVIMGTPERPELGDELAASFCSTDPAIGRHFAHVTFLSDNRADLARVAVPTLILQSAQDAIAGPVVGEYVHASIPGSVLRVLPVHGHLPHLSAPDEVESAMRGFLG